MIGAGARATSVTRMVGAMAHRGPDRTATTTVPGAAMSACRLAVTGPGPAGDQPMSDASGRYRLVFNGQIYNHRQLRAQLPSQPYRGDSDTETLLAALICWGAGALPRLEGVFTFVFLDTRTGRVLVARDRFGVRPFYVARHESTFYFASEIKAMLAAGVPAGPRVQVLRASLADYWVNGPDTPLAGVWRVPPGSLLELTVDGRLQREATWFETRELVHSDQAERLAGLSADEWSRELESTLRAAVARRLPPPGTVGTGVLCSGGLDSSLVLALACAEGIRPPALVASFTDQPEVDETRWAARVCAATGAPFVPVAIGVETWRRHFVSSVWHFEYPLVHQNSVALAALAEAARGLGLRVLLSGEGADELFGGYPSRHHAERLAFAATRPQAAPELETPARRNGRLRTAFGPAPAGAGDYAAMELAGLQEAFGDQKPERRALAAALAGDLRLFLSHGLNRLDKNLMQGSMEVREPFLDSALAAFAVNSPLERHLYPRLKAGLADVARRWLPEDVVDRPKFGFNFAVEDMLADLRPRALTDGLLVDLLEFPAGRWAELVAAMDERSRFRLWSAEIWARLFVRRDDISTVENSIWH
jgi:asparagine synthase (glutamine-hydrolysing)